MAERQWRHIPSQKHVGKTAEDLRWTKNCPHENGACAKSNGPEQRHHMEQQCGKHETLQRKAGGRKQKGTAPVFGNHAAARRICIRRPARRANHMIQRCTGRQTARLRAAKIR